MTQTSTVKQQQPIVASNPSRSEESSSIDMGLIQRVQSLAEKYDKGNAQGSAVGGPMEGMGSIKNLEDVPPNAGAALKVAAAASQVMFPNINKMVLNLCLTTKDRYLAELRKDAAKAEEIQNAMKLLIELSGQITPASKDLEELAITQKIKDYAVRLKEKGFDVFKDNELETTATLTRERITDIKFLIGTYTDMKKTELQNIFTTQIQPKITELNSILDCFKTIEKYLDRLTSGMVANQLQR